MRCQSLSLLHIIPNRTCQEVCLQMKIIIGGRLVPSKRCCDQFVRMYAEKPQVKLAKLELKKFDGEAVAGLTLTASNYDGAVEILKA